MSSLAEDQIMTDANEENDEDKQEDLKEFTKHKFECKLTLDQAAIPNQAHVLVCNPGAPTALVRILHESTWKEIGKVETAYHEKSSTSLTVYVDGNVVFVVINGSMESLFCGSIVSQLWPALNAKNCSYVCLSSTYKNNYSTFDGHMTVDSEQPLPLRYFKSQNGSSMVDVLLKQKKYSGHIEPCNQLNSMGGLNASLVMYAEMFGQAAVGIVLITDEHSITKEILTSFSPVVNGLLGSSTDLEQIWKSPNYK